MYDTIRSLVTAGLFGYLVLCVLLFVYQRNLLYYPTPNRPLVFDDFTLQQGDLDLVVRARQTLNDPALIYFGGNAEDVNFSLEAFQRTLPNTALYAMNYRGYGGSDGKPTETALVEDAVALYDHISSRHSHITLAGRSLGSGIAVPTVLVVAADDEIIPRERSEQLLQAFQPGIATLNVLVGLNHNSAIDLSEFLIAAP